MPSLLGSIIYKVKLSHMSVMVFSWLVLCVHIVHADRSAKLTMVLPLKKINEVSGAAAEKYLDVKSIDVINIETDQGLQIDPASLLAQALTAFWKDNTEGESIHINVLNSNGKPRLANFLLTRFDVEVIAISFFMELGRIHGNAILRREVFEYKNHPLSSYVQKYFGKFWQSSEEFSLHFQNLTVQYADQVAWQSDQEKKAFMQPSNRFLGLSATKLSSLKFLMENYEPFSSRLFSVRHQVFNSLLIQDLLVDFGWIIHSFRKIIVNIDRIKSPLKPLRVEPLSATEKHKKASWFAATKIQVLESKFVNGMAATRKVKERVEQGDLKRQMKENIFFEIFNSLVGESTQLARTRLGELLTLKLEKMRPSIVSVGKGKTLEWESSSLLKFGREKLTIAAVTLAPGGLIVAGFVKATVLAGLLEPETVNDLVFEEDPVDAIRIPIKWIQHFSNILKNPAKAHPSFIKQSMDFLNLPDLNAQEKLCKELLKEKKLV